MFLFLRLPGEMIRFDYIWHLTSIFQRGWNHQLENHNDQVNHFRLFFQNKRHVKDQNLSL